ncbi:hypothetical protein JQV27_17690 [Sulfitobacter mediterraneus]|jgi:hypothetical protein|uniref:hypothetical protein n=1 Tax=Sulfitobacter TaxID=60136 RepID=UPI001931B2C9|nr:MULTISPECIES: hypothetical protein [Sulfitobacter]MBM1634690.1 hypothetical protein [Sulfitobacter mediterraneus]MBM1642508.1 hypothetical protein [Sulfitobacter mediterraneus]MBM1646556.1 hypothetical protein [Sulfitobacter mediterraneus]MBM1650602.1 hypothetical protein [Sulfitobacter mediterraneus]MBM1654624.1 hypothetical protein [Sulfitobacter mediterraneus]
MIRHTALVGMLTLLVACGPPDPKDDRAGYADTRQKPTNTTPGIHVSGHVNVGVVKTF